ncbi:MAG TPA: AAA family ATPase [Allosphingosinicella sp.]|nr:AAA family ATPase [Allosphingosinicella sp.]
MRYFRRPDPPKLFESPEAERLRSEIAEFMEFARGSQERRAPFNRRFIEDPELRDALVSAFDNACAYCETPFISLTPVVAHHRPAGFAAGTDGTTAFLHYVWLSYDWANLYPVCPRCTKHKENLFPVRERGLIGAPIYHLRKVEGELLLDPCFHDPSKHLRFGSNGTISALSEAGAETLSILNLNRDDLVRQRRDALERILRGLAAGVPFRTEPTGFPSGPAAEVLVGEYVGAHRGAASFALLNLAREAGLPWGSHRLLLETLQAQPAARARLLGEAGPAAARAEPKAKAAKPRPARSRAFRVNRQPLAKVPIEKVTIRNFKALTAIDFALPVTVDDPNLVPCMLLLGENAAGKSSVLEAITLALLGTRETGELDKMLQHEVKPSDVVHRPDLTKPDSIPADSVSVEVRFLSQSEPAQISAPGKAKRFQGSEEPAKVVLAYGPRRFFTSRKTRRLRAPANRVRSLFDPMATIASPLEWLLRCSDDDFVVAVRTLREILMLGEDARIDRDKVRQRLDIQTAAGPVPLEEMSVGYKSVIAMATDIMRELMLHYDNVEFAPAVVLIDEIETHLHPRWKLRIVGLLRQAFPKVQFIITTHDPLCLRGMFDGEVFVLQRDPDTAEVAKLDELPSIRGMRAEQLLMSEYFGLGSTDPETDAKLIRYQNLVTRGVEGDEVDKLRRELESTMKVGDTIQQQVFAEAMRDASIDPLIPLGRAKSPPRREMVRAILEKIESARAGSVPEPGS